VTEQDIIVLGLSHHTATLAAREQVALDDAQARVVSRLLAADPRVGEAMVLSTCNRTEIYATAAVRADGETALRRALQAGCNVGVATVASSSYVLCDGDAVEHLFRVAAGLDSAVLGESEIAGQLRRAAERAEQEGVAGAVLGEAVRRALVAGRRVRRETRVAQGSTSLATAVARSACAHQRDGAIVMVGAGQLIEGIALALHGQGARDLVVVNRTLATAQRIAAAVSGRAVDLGRLRDELGGADVVISATDAPRPVLTAAMVHRAAPGRALAIFDLAVPRDVEPGVGRLAHVTVCDIDEVHVRLERARDARRQDLDAAHALIGDEARRFGDWHREMAVAPVIAELWRRAEEVRRSEVARRGAALDAEEAERLDAATAAIVRRLLDGPTKRLRAAARAGAVPDVGALLGEPPAAPAPAPARPRLRVVTWGERGAA